MTLVTDILDRLSGIATVRERLAQQEKVMEGIQRVILEHQRDIAELKGSMKAMIAISARTRAP